MKKEHSLHCCLVCVMVMVMQRLIIITVTIDCRSNHVVVFALNQMRIAVGWPDDGLVPDLVPLMRMRMMVMTRMRMMVMTRMRMMVMMRMRMMLMVTIMTGLSLADLMIEGEVAKSDAQDHDDDVVEKYEVDNDDRSKILCSRL